jgi:hypothetical protein
MYLYRQIAKMSPYKFLAVSFLNVFFTLNAFSQWKLKIIEESSHKRLQFEHVESRKIETSQSFQDIILPYISDSLFSDIQRKTLRVRYLHKNKWGLMNGQFKTLIKPQFEYLEIFINRYSDVYPDRPSEIRGYLGTKGTKYYVYNLDFKPVDQSGFSAVQGIGMDFQYPTKMPDEDVQRVLREYDNQNLILLHSSPLLVLSKNGIVEKKQLSHSKLEEVTYIDSNGEEFYRMEEVTQNQFYYHIQGASWNLYDVFNQQLWFKQWLDSITFIYIKCSSNPETWNVPFSLDSLQRHSSEAMLVSYNHTDVKLQDFRLFQEHSKLWCIPICLISSNGFEHIFDLRNPQKTFPQLNRPAEIFNASIGVHYLGIREHNQLRLFDILQQSYHPQVFDAIYPEEHVTITKPSYEKGYYSEITYTCEKVKINEKLGVYHFEDTQFYEITGLEDVDFKQGSYSNPLGFYTGASRFFIGKSGGKWGLTTLNIIQSKDSISVPFVYDSLVFEHYDMNNIIFWYLKAKQNGLWKLIDLHNNPIMLPDQEEENVLMMKAFFDMGHQGMSNYYLLTNPIGTKIKNAFKPSQEYSDYNFEAPSVVYSNDIVVGGKTLVYNNFLRKVVDETLYDSIWLITAYEENTTFQRGYNNSTYYQYFSWSNPYHVNDMTTSYSYVTIDYYLIFKNGLNAIISDKNEIIVPFTKEPIEVSRRNIIRDNTPANDEIDSEWDKVRGKDYDLIAEYSFRTPTKTITIEVTL